MNFPSILILKVIHVCGLAVGLWCLVIVLLSLKTLKMNTLSLIHTVAAYLVQVQEAVLVIFQFTIYPCLLTNKALNEIQSNLLLLGHDTQQKAYNMKSELIDSLIIYILK